MASRFSGVLALTGGGGIWVDAGSLRCGGGCGAGTTDTVGRRRGGCRPGPGRDQTTDTVSLEWRPATAAAGPALGRTCGYGETQRGNPAEPRVPDVHLARSRAPTKLQKRTLPTVAPASRPRLGKPVPDHPARPARVLPVAASAQRNARHAPVAQGIEQRPPEPCAQVRILPGAHCVSAPKTPSPAETLRPGSSRMCRRVPPGAAVCQGLWTRRGRDLDASAQVSAGKRQGPRTRPGA